MSLRICYQLYYSTVFKQMQYAILTGYQFVASAIAKSIKSIEAHAFSGYF